MATVEPQVARFQIETTVEALSATIPARKNWFALLFMCVWMGGWVFGETQVIGQLLDGDDKTPLLFLTVWLIGWTAGGVWAIASILWQLGGQEIIAVGASYMLHRIEIFGLGINRDYRLSEVQNFRATELASDFSKYRGAMLPAFFGPSAGPVAFDYGARTIRMAPSLDEAEARQLVQKLAPRLPRKLEQA